MPRRRRVYERPVDERPADDPARALVEALAGQMDILERHLAQVYEESYIGTGGPAGHVRVTSMTVEYRHGSDDVALGLEGRQQPGSGVVAGVHRGVVVESVDPHELGRLLVRIPSVLGEDARWALPALASPAADRPAIGDRVWILFEEGSVESPVWLGSAP